MKKTLLLLLSLLAVGGLLYLMISGERLDKKKSLMENEPIEKRQEPVIGKEEPRNETKDGQEDESVSNDKNLGCAEKLGKEFPGASEQYDRVAYDIFLTKEEMMGTDQYASLDMPSLRALAYANDIKAMLYYSEKIIVESQNISNNQTPATGEKTIDYETFGEGIELQWRLTVKARPAFISNIASHYMYLAGSQLNQGESLDKTISTLAKAKAYILLTERVFEKDPHLQRVLSSRDYFEERVQKNLRSKDNYNELTNEISKQAVKIYQELAQKWEKERNYHGLPVYPDYFTKEVEQFAQRLEEQCWN